jgi:hypothetical protein
LASFRVAFLFPAEAVASIAVALARKRRTPPPPRRVQAPKTRKDERPPVERRTLLIAAAAAVAAAVAGGAFLLFGGSDGSGGVRTAMREAGCTYREVPAGPAAVHIQNPDGMPDEWQTMPPTSGPHFGEPAIFGMYEEPIQLARAVHNLEHGGIAIYYGDDVPEEQVEALRRFYREDPVGLLLAPLPRIGNKIALTAWTAPVQGEEGDPLGHLAECTRFDAGAFDAFRDDLRFRGPERFPPEALRPGS